MTLYSFALAAALAGILALVWVIAIIVPDDLELTGGSSSDHACGGPF